MTTHLKPDAIIALHYLGRRFNATDRLIGNAIGQTSITTRTLMTELGVRGLVSYMSGAWSITPAGRIARVLGTY